MKSTSAPSSPGFARKSRLVITAHWLSAAAIMLAYGMAWTRELFEDDSLADSLLGLHRQLGLLVLLLLCVRLIGRQLQPATKEAEALPAALRWAGTLSHWMLYALLLSMPLLGWAMTSAQGHPVQLFKLLTLPALTQVDPDLADSLQEWHELAAWCLLVLVSLHVLAALWHHLIRRDAVLASMLPIVRPRPRQRADQ